MKTLKAAALLPVVLVACLVGFARDGLADLWRELRNA